MFEPATVVDCAVYVAGKRLPGEWTYTAALTEVRGRGEGFVWIGLFEPERQQFHGLARTCGLRDQAADDAIRRHRRPTLDHRGDTLFMAMKTVCHVENESPETANEIVLTGEIMAFLGKDFIVTVRHGQHSGLHGLRTELEAEPERLQAGPATVLHAIADRVVDEYLSVTDACETDIDLMESLVFAARSQVGAEQMYLMRREILELRRAVAPLAVPLHRLVEGATPLVPDEVRSYLRDVEDHLTTVSERIARFDELLTSLLSATVAKVTLQLNGDMRKISSWVAIISVPTMVVGVYGMNFDHMPELHWTYGRPLVLSVVLIACVVLYRLLKRNKWL
ncbi:magnesium and cobalt transport protein CorA [Lentzea cavernae]|uniref:Magnesium transport protein CorA n=1 Tax=Lentzea cavernae TaxID=2020703 RepID=A0ABQ3M3A7_9PSEU|nr:magnesium and cobalt transport protein CorA [Lentzea cavernae]GHH32650.1 magnesium transport protein CorA [Lentzea cavernae]